MSALGETTARCASPCLAGKAERRGSLPVRRNMRFAADLHSWDRHQSRVQLLPWPPYSKAVSGTASRPPSPLSVRYFSTRSSSVPAYDDREGLNLELPLAQSAFSPLLSAACLKIAVGIARGRPEVFTIGSTGLLAATNRAAG
jgi:hypothetical protein